MLGLFISATSSLLETLLFLLFIRFMSTIRMNRFRVRPLFLLMFPLLHGLLFFLLPILPLATQFLTLLLLLVTSQLFSALNLLHSVLSSLPSLSLFMFFSIFSSHLCTMNAHLFLPILQLGFFIRFSWLRTMRELLCLLFVFFLYLSPFSISTILNFSPIFIPAF